MASLSTVTDGNLLASMSATAQCVVTRLPSRRPAAARKKAPLHTEPNLRVREARRRSQSITLPSAGTSAAFGHPATSKVSMGSWKSRSTIRSGISRMPEELRIGPGSAPATNKA